MFPQMKGRSDFMFRLVDISAALGDQLENYELHVTVEVYDWFLQQNQTGSAICVVYGQTVTMKLLGDRSRSFKPGFPVSVYVS